VKLLVKPLSVVATVSAAALLTMGINTFTHQNEAVASTANTLTGSCGGVFGFQKKGKQGAFTGNNETVNILFHADFEGIGKGITIVFTHRDTVTQNGSGFKTINDREIKFPITDISPHPHLPGAFKVSYTNTEENKSQIANFKPVNGGTTFLIQVADDDITGICQKI